MPDERVIIFTEYRDTQTLAARAPHRRAAIRPSGSPSSTAARTRTSASTSRPSSRTIPDLDPVRILLATDAASEGINLQNHCHRLLHWEIPWNPNRLEQRNGRIDRHGQPAPEVNVYHFVPKGWEDGRRPAGRDGALEDELTSSRSRRRRPSRSARTSAAPAT